MEQIALGVGAGMLFSLVTFVGILMSKAGGIGKAFWGLDVAGKAYKDPTVMEKINAALGGKVEAKPTVPAPKKPSGEALKLIRILQAEARLIDFLMEDLSNAPAEAIRDGVIKVQKDAVAALNKHMTIVPVLAGTEGDSVTVEKGYDPSSITVTGNVTGEPPFRGELQHPGWKVKDLKLPAEAEGQNAFVVQPAEVSMT
jgi:hypothetical protein